MHLCALNEETYLNRELHFQKKKTKKTLIKQGINVYNAIFATLSTSHKNFKKFMNSKLPNLSKPHILFQKKELIAGLYNDFACSECKNGMNRDSPDGVLTRQLRFCNFGLILAYHVNFMCLQKL